MYTEKKDKRRLPEIRILIAEDEPEIARQYKVILEARSHSVLITEDGDRCLEEYHKALQELQQEQQQQHQEGTQENSDSAAAGSVDGHSGDNNKDQKKPGKPALPFDAVILDYKMPKKDGMEVAKEILAINRLQRIIFASAFVKQTLEHSIKELGQVVELIQKPFELRVLVDIVEDKAIFQQLEQLNVNVKHIKELGASHFELDGLLEGLRKIMKDRAF